MGTVGVAPSPAEPRSGKNRFRLGPGDDAALFRAGGETWAVTTDMLVEGVHFRRRWTGGADLGHKTSGRESLGPRGHGRRRAGFGRVLSAGSAAGDARALRRGFLPGIFAALARRSGFKLVGGDTVRAARLTFSLTALGRVRGPVFRRSTARPGDLVAGHGHARRRGRRVCVILEKRGRPATADERFLVDRFRRPTPRLAWARALARSGGKSRRALDVSDGLVAVR
jgi:thiamine-monophosphate kinase